MTIFYKATRPDGRDFYSGQVHYEVGDTFTKPEVENPRCCSSDVLHASTVPTETLIGGSWPCRLFEVEGAPVAEEGEKRGFFSLTVAREIEAHRALGPQGEHAAALVTRAGTLTSREARNLSAAHLSAAWSAAWDAAWDAAWSAAEYAARYTAWYAARNAAGYAAWDAAWDADRDGAEYAARDAARALVVRDLIGHHGFSQEHYDTLTEPWRKAIGSIHPDDAEMSA